MYINKDVLKKLKKRYVVTINFKIPYISVSEKPYKSSLEKPGQFFVPTYKKLFYTKEEYLLQNSLWFCQGEEAQNLMDEICDDLNHSEYVLTYLYSSGILFV